jgi:hypothetical protein
MAGVNKKIIVLPGTFQCVKNYGGYDGVDIWMGEENQEKLSGVDYFIGHSLGVNFILNAVCVQEQKFIFINPLIKKRGVPSLLYQWLRFLLFEGIKKEKVVPIKYWATTFKKIAHLLKTDVLETMQKLPKENVYIIGGKADNYFCDTEDLEILKANEFNIIEVDAGHDWNENVAKAVADIIKD